MHIFHNTTVRGLTALFILLTVILISGCSGSGTEPANPNTSDGNKDTISVTDCIGRQVDVPAHVERIACLYAFSGHVTVMLGRGADVVAINNGLSRDILLNKVCPGINDNPVCYYNALNIEELIKTEPDLVFIPRDLGQNEAEVEKLDKFKIPYVVVCFNNIEEQMNAIEVIGKTLGVTDKAREYNQYYQDCVERVENAVADIPESNKVRLYHSVNEATRTDSPNSLSADWIEKVGVINVSTDKSLKLLEGKNYASLEQILLWDPDVIIANESGVAEYIMTNEKWSPLKAVKAKKVYQMPVGISRWGHPGGLETPLGILWTAKTVYPERFENLDINSEASTYYQRFFNYSVTDNELMKIMSGEGMREAKNKK